MEALAKSLAFVVVLIAALVIAVVIFVQFAIDDFNNKGGGHGK